MKKFIKGTILFALVASCGISFLAAFNADNLDVIILDLLIALFFVAVIARLESWWRDLADDDDSEELD